VLRAGKLIAFLGTEGPPPAFISSDGPEIWEAGAGGGHDVPRFDKSWLKAGALASTGESRWLDIALPHGCRGERARSNLPGRWLSLKLDNAFAPNDITTARIGFVA